MEMNGVRVGQTMLGFNQFGPDTEVDPGQIDGAVLLVMGVGEPSTVDLDGEAVLRDVRAQRDKNCSSRIS